MAILGTVAKVMVSLPDDVLARIDDEAERRGTSRSALLREAALRELEGELAAEFERPTAEAAAVLAWADLTSTPRGDSSSVDDRLADILHRYPPASIVHRAIVEASPMLRQAASEVESRLAELTEAA